MGRKRYFLWICCLALLMACQGNRLDIQLNSRDLNINYINADSLFSQQPKDTVRKNLISLYKKVGRSVLYELSEDTRQRIYDTSFIAVYNFYNTEYIKAMESAKRKLYKQLSKQKKQINKGFHYLSHYFGDSIIPKHILFINKLFSGINCFDSTITIGLENYLNPKDSLFKRIPSTRLYSWRKKRMNIKYLSRDVLFNAIRVKLIPNLNDKLAHHIIQAGKCLYLLNACFPEASEAYILRYNNKEYQWASQNEEGVWHYLVEKQYLFKNDPTIKANFLGKGPTTPGLPKDAPDRMGQFIGYKIVKGYMKQNKNVTLPQLLKIKYNRILQSYQIE